MINLRSRLASNISGKQTGSPLIDIGTTSLTGIRANALPHKSKDKAAYPVYGTVPLEPLDCIRLGSDFIRSGLLFAFPAIADDSFIDAYGVEWIHDGSAFSPVSHPLETAALSDIVRYPKLQWHQKIQPIESKIANNYLIIADAPCPGLLNLCFMLRNTWRFLEDIADNRQIATALLEWSAETIVDAYKYMLSSLSYEPDIIIYADDLGHQDGMFFSPLDFRKYIRPFMHSLLTRLRQLTPATICFHSCGAIRPILKDVAGLGIEIFNLDTKAKGMSVQEVRQELPAHVVLHGSNDLCALGRSVANRDMAGIARLITELAKSSPVIAAPLDNLSSTEEVLAAEHGAAFIRNFSDEDFEKIRNIGPVRSIIEEATDKTLSKELPAV